LRLRERLLSEAFRPAETTDLWAHPSHQLTMSERHRALEGVSVVIAHDEHEEALSIAIALRETLEDPQATAALITPDRTLAERVSAELRRWNIQVNDTGGMALVRTPVGSLAMLVAEYLAKPHPEVLFALLNHPLSRCGLSGEQREKAGEALACGVFQGRVPHTGIKSLLTHLEHAGQEAKEGRHVPWPMRRLTAEHWQMARCVLEQVDQVLSPLLLAFEQGEPNIHDFCKAHFEACLSLAYDENGKSGLLDQEFGSELRRLFDELGACSRAPVPVSAYDYQCLMGAMLRETIVRSRDYGHPQVQIWGLLEARLLRADRVVLGGLDEYIWPPAASPDSFLTRSMRLTLGLPPPEQHIGQTAHDFIAAMGHTDVVITRALKRGTSPSVPSRFLQRLAACVGQEAWRIPCERGQRFLTWVRQLDEVEPVAAVKRPNPTPPADVQPTSLSITEVETLIRDPYAIYAKHVLKLMPLSGMRTALESSDYGQWVHAVFEGYGRARTRDPHGDPEQVFAHALAHTLHAYADFPEVTRVWLSRFGKIGNAFRDWDARQRVLCETIVYEARARHTFSLPDGTPFTLRGYADRLQKRQDGRVDIFDFKTGTPPSKAQIYQGSSAAI
jgi:ATP-dependent helicase/nuclease subunit B